MTIHLLLLIMNWWSGCVYTKPGKVHPKVHFQALEKMKRYIYSSSSVYLVAKGEVQTCFILIHTKMTKFQVKMHQITFATKYQDMNCGLCQLSNFFETSKYFSLDVHQLQNLVYLQIYADVHPIGSTPNHVFLSDQVWSWKTQVSDCSWSHGLASMISQYQSEMSRKTEQFGTDFSRCVPPKIFTNQAGPSFRTKSMKPFHGISMRCINLKKSTPSISIYLS